MVNSDLYNFIIVAEELSITGAASRLFIAQQTLSEQIKRLEKNYGKVFFERKPHLKLTPQGERMLKYARIVVEAEQQLRTDLDRIDNDRSFKIGYSGAKGAMILSASLPEFAQRYPQSGISLISISPPILPRMLESGDVDAYIISGADAPADCINEVLYISRFKYLCRKDLFSKYCDPQAFQSISYEEKIKAIARIPFSAAPKNFPLRKTIEVFFRKHGAEPNITHSATSAAINSDICKLGRAAIVLPEEMFSLYTGSMDPDEFISFDLPDMKEIEPLSFVCRQGQSKVDIQEMISILKSNAPV